MFLSGFPPSPILVYIGTVPLHWYGFLLACAVALGYGVTYYLSKKERIHIDTLFFLCFIVGLVSARLLFVCYHIDYFMAYPFEIPLIWHGGIVWHGALIGGFGAVYLYCRRYKHSLFGITDILVPGLALGQALGRWGNYFNQENYGLPTNLPWAIPIDLAHRLPGYESFTSFHPTFLYESIGSLILFVFLMYLVRKQAAVQSGLITAVYLLGYSLMRLFIEFLRVDSVPVLFGMRMPQVISIFLICIGSFLLLKTQRRDTRQV
ncbi:prolipoprotein diacylglyceryl transferase [Candidatus Uhrbacteria bacterium]|nr:prolipoprotein diacylglyceryl transferase [Candidatus Uhrbacteria bacterium]